MRPLIRMLATVLFVAPAQAREAASLRHPPTTGPVLTDTGVAFVNDEGDVVVRAGTGAATVVAHDFAEPVTNDYETNVAFLTSGEHRLGVEALQYDSPPKGGGSGLVARPFAGPEGGPLQPLAPACGFFASGAPTGLAVSDHADVFVGADCRLAVTADDGPSFALPESARLPRLAGNYLGYLEVPDPSDTANADVVVVDRHTRQEVLRFGNPDRVVVGFALAGDGTVAVILSGGSAPRSDARDLVVASPQQPTPRMLMAHAGDRVRVDGGRVLVATGNPLHAVLREVDVAAATARVLAAPVTGDFDLRGDRVAWSRTDCRRVRVIETTLDQAPGANPATVTCPLRLAARPLVTARWRHLRLQLACDGLPADCLPDTPGARVETARSPHRSVILRGGVYLDYAGRLDMRLTAAAGRRLRDRGRLRLRLTDRLTAGHGSTERRSLTFTLTAARG